MDDHEAGIGPLVRTGRFWLSNAPDVVVPGQLTLAPGGPQLALQGSLTPALKPDPDATPNLVTTRYILNDDDDEAALVIHGELDAGLGTESVSLLKTFSIGRVVQGARVGPDVGRQQLKAIYALRGAHLDDHARFTGLRVRLHHLEDWAYLGGFTIDPAASIDSVSIRYQRPHVAPAPLSSGAQVGLDQDLDYVGGDNSCSLTRTVWLCVDDLPAATWRELDRGVLTPLITLLTLAVGAECPPVAIELYAESQTVHKAEVDEATDEATEPAAQEAPPGGAGDAGWLPLHSGGLRPPVAQSRSVHDMLLPRHVLGLTGIAAWLEQVDVLGPLPPVVAAAATSQAHQLETEVLELATVAEGLARRLHPTMSRFTAQEVLEARHAARAAVAHMGDAMAAAVDGALAHQGEPSYPQRLEQLAERTAAIIPEAVGQRTDDGRPSRWKKSVLDARNDFAHRRDPGWVSDAGVDRYLAVNASLRWLLTAVLLQQTGVPSTTLAARLRAHQPYQLFLKQAHQWLPRVYP